MKVLTILVLAALCTACANHCRIGDRIPKDATYEDLERMPREQCK